MPPGLEDEALRELGDRALELLDDVALELAELGGATIEVALPDDVKRELTRGAAMAAAFGRAINELGVDRAALERIYRQEHDTAAGEAAVRAERAWTVGGPAPSRRLVDDVDALLEDLRRARIFAGEPNPRPLG